MEAGSRRNEIKTVPLTDEELEEWDKDPKCPSCGSYDWTPEGMGLCACDCGAVWHT